MAFRKKQQQSAAFDATAQVGALAPLGYWDPLDLCPRNEKNKFRKFRMAELKHGRVAMLASVGLVVQHFVDLPVGDFDEVPNGVYAPLNPLGLGGCLIIIFFSLVIEFAVWAQDPAREPGDFGDPLNIGMYDTDMRNRELNNGRFAMFATVGILLAELATGKDAVEQLGLAAPPAATAVTAAAPLASGAAAVGAAAMQQPPP